MGRNRGGSDRLVHSVMQLAGPAAVELQSHLCNKLVHDCRGAT